MSNVIAVKQEQRMLSPQEVKQHVGLIQNVMRDVMKDGTHYGTIPGCRQPSLYKAGSEVLLTTFKIGTRLEVTDLSTDDCIRYQVKVIGFHQPTGTIIGEGVGECSTNEEKYKWRAAVCEEEFDDTPETRRRVKYISKWDNRTRSKTAFKVQQIRTEPADMANTVLKMAKKRAQIDFTLTALGASDIFAQDIEDLPEELRQAAAEGVDGQTGEPLEHDALKSATTVPELTEAMNSLSTSDRKKYIGYFNKRREELMEAQDASAK